MGILDPKQISTQDHLDIEDIRDNLVILKNGVVSVVIETSSMNFELLDSTEQDARIFSFAALLNSLRFPIQIVIRTQRTDIGRYLKLLESYKAKTSSEQIYNQVTKYQEYISTLTQTAQILDKRFYAVIPSIQLPVIQTNWVRSLFGKEKKMLNIKEVLQKAKDELIPKRDHVIKQFGNMGISAKQLENDELIKLYYTVYEPDKAGIETLTITQEDIKEQIIKG